MNTAIRTNGKGSNATGPRTYACRNGDIIPPLPKTILVVDDNVVFLKAMSMKLRSFGYEVITAVDGATAVRMVRQVRPDLILLDLNFPPDVSHGGGVGWNGLLILAWLRRMEEGRDIPVIAVSSDAFDSHKEECVAAGLVDFFQKPVDHDTLLASIRDALKEKVCEDHDISGRASNGKFRHEAASGKVFTHKKILFVDDESDWRFMGTLYLTECGYDVFSASNAEEAIETAAEAHPHVIVLDLNLGDDNGATLLKLLAVTYPKTPILIYTGAELDEAAVSELEEEGAFECLRKGTMEELLISVGKAMEAAADAPEVLALHVDNIPETIQESSAESILIVEDDIDFGDALRTFLESHPFSVVRVSDGAEALRQISAVDFDFIFCDMVLPNVPGDQLYREVERIKPHLCKRFVFMTGHNADPRTDGFIRRVRGLMLWKPFHLEDLLTATDIIRRKRASA